MIYSRSYIPGICFVGGICMIYRSYIHVRLVGSADLRDLHMFHKVGSV